MGRPLFWGLMATLSFYLLIGWGVIQNELVMRYFAGHPVEYIETGLFFVGIAALVLKALDLGQQFRAIHETNLPSPDENGDDPDRAGALLNSIGRLPAYIRESYLGQRLQNVLRHVYRSETAQDLDQQLRYLSDMDAEKADESYALVRMIVWATPMLGFLGTVIGITLALGDLSPEALIDAPKEAMQGLLAGLSIAFDTTALALSLSILLMFGQYLVRQVETQLLSLVDRRVLDEMIGRFQQAGTQTDPNIQVVKQMSERVIQATEDVVSRQAEVWKQVLSSSQREWSEALYAVQRSVQASFETSLTRSMTTHAESLTSSQKVAGKQASEYWAGVQQTMLKQADALTAQHGELVKQGNVMLRVLKATGEVTTLEKALNQNLAALAGAKNFEDTVMSLSAAIQLLSSRLGVAANQRVTLPTEQKRRGRAA